MKQNEKMTLSHSLGLIGYVFSLTIYGSFLAIPLFVTGLIQAFKTSNGKHRFDLWFNLLGLISAIITVIFIIYTISSLILV